MQAFTGEGNTSCGPGLARQPVRTLRVGRVYSRRRVPHPVLKASHESARPWHLRGAPPLPVVTGNLGLLARSASSVAASSPPLGSVVRAEGHSGFLLWLSLVTFRTFPPESPGRGSPPRTGPTPSGTSRVAGRPHAIPPRGRIITLLEKWTSPLLFGNRLSP